MQGGYRKHPGAYWGAYLRRRRARYERRRSCSGTHHATFRSTTLRSHGRLAGAVAGGEGIRPLNWDSVGSILHRGGTIIGTARSKEFPTREGMLSAAANLLEHGIDRLVVIGGDGSLTGTNEFRKAWPSLLAELMTTGRITSEVAAAHPS